MSTVFLTDNLIEKSEIFTDVNSTSNEQFPLSNIKHPHTTKVAKIAFSGARGGVIIDLGVAQGIDIVAICGSVRDGFTFNKAYIKGSATTDFSNADEYEIDLSVQYNFGFKNLPFSNFRFWHVSFEGVLEVDVPKIFIGKKKGFINNGIQHNSFTYLNNELSSIASNKWGQTFVDKNLNLKQMKGSLKTLSGEEYDLVRNIYNDVRIIKPFWFILDLNGEMPEADSQFLYGGYFRFASPFSYKMVVQGVFDIELQLEQYT